MKITAILRKIPSGEGIVYIRVNHGQAKTYHTTGIRLKENQFREGRVIDHPRARALNDKIKVLIAQRQVKAGEGVKEKKAYSDAKFEDYAMTCLQEWTKSKRDSTLYQYKGEIERFVLFAGNMPLSRITPQILSSYKSHILLDRSSNTAWKSLKFLKTIFHKAIREKVIEHNPFDQVETIKYKNPPKQFLTQEQIDSIDTYVQREDTPPQIAFIGNWFLIGCYTGLRFSDMQKFNKGMIRKGRLVLYTTKTSEPVSLPIEGQFKKIGELLDRVSYSHLDLHNAKYNEYLKVLAKATDLPPVNAHMSRHSFAVRCADAGISPEVTAKLMGIVNLKVVAIYYKLGSKRIDDEFGKLF